MDRALKTGKEVVKGSFWLFTGRLISTFLLAIGTILLGVYIGEGEYGFYAVALILPTTLLLFQDWGVSSAMTKYCSLFKREKKEDQLRKLIKVGLAFESVTATVLTVISLLIGNFVASVLFTNNTEGAFFVYVASILIFPSSFLTVIQSIFIGFEKMRLNTLLIICQAAIQSFLSLLLVYMGYGVLGALVGYIFSYVCATFLGLILLQFKIFNKLPAAHEPSNKLNASQALRLLLSFGIPLGVSTILSGIMTQFYSIIMASYVDAVMIGNYKIAHNFATMVTLITFPLYTVLFPAYAKYNPDTEQHLLRSIFSSSVKYVAFLLVPATMAVMVLSEPLISTLYADKWSYAPLFLSFGVIGNLLIIFGNVNVNSLLTGLGKTKILMKLSILVILIGVPTSFLLIPEFGILGLILAGLVSNIPSVIISLYYVWKHYKIKAEFRTSSKIFFASVVAASTTWLFLNVFTAASWMMFTIGVTLFVATYLIVAPLVGAINKSDLSDLKIMFSSLGFVSRLVDIPLSIMSWVLNLGLNKRKEGAKSS